MVQIVGDSRSFSEHYRIIAANTVTSLQMATFSHYGD